MTASAGESAGASSVAVEVMDERIEGSSVVRVLRVREKSTALEGHFPGKTLVPGVVQVQWALDAAARVSDAMPMLRRIETLKFKAAIRPGQRVEVAVELSPARDQMQFRIGFGGRIFSSGRCVLRPAAPAPP